MTVGPAGFDYQSVLAEACERLGIPFDRSRGELFIRRTDIEPVLSDVIAQGFKVLGLEGFERVGSVIHPRIDLIYDSERSSQGPLDALTRFDDVVWIDVVLAAPRDIGAR